MLTIDTLKPGDIFIGYDGNIYELLRRSYGYATVKPIPGERRDVANGMEVEKVIGRANT